MPNNARSRGAKADTPSVAIAEKLPHEHDESAESGAPRRAVITQAESDVRHGLVDTDNYTRARDLTRGVLDAPKRRQRS